jgi:uncharacterized protein (DUF1810 family)
MSDPYELQRFVDAQSPIYERVLSELRGGRKKSHWMWFVFPQIEGLGRSELSVKFAISGRREAKAYLDHATLGPRLRECTTLVLKADAKPIERIFGSPDDMKFQSCMTLFDAVAPGTVFGEALEAFFAGRRDQLTLDALAR